MLRKSLGIYYEIPITSTSSLVPPTTLRPDIPMDRLVPDVVMPKYEAVIADMGDRIRRFIVNPDAGGLPEVLQTSWPNMVSVGKQGGHAFVDTAWPIVQSRMPEAWDTVRPQVSADANAFASDEKAKLLRLGAVAAIAVLGAAALWYRYKR